MLVLKAIGKVLGDLLMTLVICFLAVTALFGATALVAWVLRMLGKGITALIGEATAAAIGAFFETAFIWVLLGLAVLCIIAMLVIEVRQQYLIEKGRAGK